LAALTIRNIEDNLKRDLRKRAAANDRSMEEEARVILRNAIAPASDAAQRGLGTEIRRRIEELGGGIDWDLPTRGPARPLPPPFDE
jgi:plasmid stability protein